MIEFGPGFYSELRRDDDDDPDAPVEMVDKLAHAAGDLQELRERLYKSLADRVSQNSTPDEIVLAVHEELQQYEKGTSEHAPASIGGMRERAEQMIIVLANPNVVAQTIALWRDVYGSKKILIRTPLV